MRLPRREATKLTIIYARALLCFFVEGEGQGRRVAKNSFFQHCSLNISKSHFHHKLSKSHQFAALLADK